MSKATVDTTPAFKPGDPPPEGYREWHAWAEVQHKAGLRQTRCKCCGLYRFPQEMAGEGATICKECQKLKRL